MNATSKPGFYGNDNDVVYLAPSGRIWLVASPDTDATPEELGEMPEGMTGIDELLTPDEAVEYCRQVEEESGESLLSD